MSQIVAFCTLILPTIWQVVMKERTTLTMYVITKWTLEYQKEENPEEGIQMMIILKRRIINELLTSYLPSVLLILISYSTTFFRPFYFEVQHGKL